MMRKTPKGSSEAAYANWSFLHRRNQSFLQRNVRKVIRCLEMGSVLSNLRGTPIQPQDHVRAKSPSLNGDEHEDDNQRPAKRQRTTQESYVTAPQNNHAPLRELADHITNESARAPSRPKGKLQAFKPADFYGVNRPVRALTPKARSDVRLEAILPPDPIHFEKFLRVDLFGIIQKTGADKDWALPSRKDRVDIKCRFFLSIYYAKDTSDPKALFKNQDPTLLLQTSQVGILRVSKGSNNTFHRQFTLPEPFLIPAEQLYVNKKVKTSKLKKESDTQQILRVHDLADIYSFYVRIEPIGSHEDWPPINISPPALDPNPLVKSIETSEINYGDLTLDATLLGVLDPHKQKLDTLIYVSNGRKSRDKANYLMQVDVRWSLPLHLRYVPEILKHNKVEGPSTPEILDIPDPLAHTSPAKRKRADLLDTKPAESRAHRQRKDIPTYNLKALGAQTLGHSPRKTRGSRPPGLQESSQESGSIEITYTFGKAESGEFGIRRQTTIHGLNCPLCDHGSSSLVDFRIHLATSHVAFKFHLRRANKTRVSFFVDLSRQGKLGSPANSVSRTIQLGRSSTLFDLEKFLNGDESWAKAREGPLHHQLLGRVAEDGYDSSLSPSLQESCYSSPNTSHGTDGCVTDTELQGFKLPVRARAKLLVPKTTKPLYHTITKRRLIPGEEIPDSDDEQDEIWLHQKSKDIIEDFSDVTGDEKDYITHWNPFIMNELIASDRYLPMAVKRFIHANTDWFAERSSRKREFGKHMEIFVLRGVIPQRLVHESLNMLREAELTKRRSKGHKPWDPPAESFIKPRGTEECSCGRFVPLSDRLICHGVSCRSRYFHRECVKRHDNESITGWICDACVTESQGQNRVET